MRVKVRIKDFKGKTVEIQKETRAQDHLAAQMKYKKQVFKDKTKYTRKKKHKNKTDE